MTTEQQATALDPLTSQLLLFGGENFGSGATQLYAAGRKPTLTVATGTAGSFSMPIPVDPNLAGLVYFVQAFSQDRAGTAIATNQIVGTIGF